MSGPVRSALAVTGGGAVVAAVLAVGSLLAGRSSHEQGNEFRAIMLFIVAAFLLGLAGVVFAQVRFGRRRQEVPASGRFAHRDDPAVARIRLERPRDSASDVLRRYAVRIDGHRVAELGIGQYVTATVAAGTHTVEASLADQTSPTITVECAAGATARILVEPTPGNAAARRQTDWLLLSRADL